MAVAGVICEYNPFHLGHAWMLEELKRQGMDAVVCVMSGNFVQRGEFALLSKHARAEMAVRCGADLVLELPTPWSAATAELFALGGVSLLQQTGVVTHLAFGSEAGDAAPIEALARTLHSDEYHQILRQKLTSGQTFAVCRREAVAQLLGEEAAGLLDGPNNNLGVEYCRALQTLEADMIPVTVQRTGAAHDGAPQAGIASASHIRQLLLGGKMEEAAAFLPASSVDILRREMEALRAPVTVQNCERAVLSQLRRMDEEDFAPFDGGSEGLYRRVCRAVQDSTSLEEILEKAKTKRYTHARLRRLLLSAYLGMSAPSPVDRPPYLRVLAAGEKGRPLLRQMRKAGAPVLTKPADVAKLGPQAEKMFRAEARRTDLWALACPALEQSRCGADWRQSPILL